MTKKGVSAAMIKPTLRFRPTAWAKLLYLRDAGQTEIGGFALTAPNEPLCVESFELVTQRTSPTHVELLDDAVADYFDRQVNAGRQPNQFARIWLHTHPGCSAQPSATDEATFARVFGRVDWAVMGILARGGETYARLRFGVGPSADLEIGVEVDFRPPFGASDVDAWQAEYALCVLPQPQLAKAKRSGRVAADDSRPTETPTIDEQWLDAWYEYHDVYEEPPYGYIRDFC
jgi:proteasome lid subunit RPN8/RPN11